jgi:patatin-like phospholipase/acyl hydrolase
MFPFHTSHVFVLSVDGGGIRGIIPALILRELEHRLQRRGRRRKPLHRFFDLVAGTSTGGLIALGLGAPRRTGAARGPVNRNTGLTPDELVDVYQRRGAEIFPRWKFNALRSVLQAFGDKYDAANLEQVLYDLFGDLTLQDALTNVLVTSYDTERRQPHFFKSWNSAEGTERDFFMRDVGRATAAAPTFFEPAYIASVPDDGERFCLLDGAVIANNPALCAYVEAYKLFPHAKDFTILSIGTGSTVEGFEYEDIRNWGYLDWVSPVKGMPLSSMMTDAQSQLVNHQLHKLPGLTYHRWNGPLTDCSEEMDDASEENLAALRRFAYGVIEANSEQIDAVCHELQHRH